MEKEGRITIYKEFYFHELEARGELNEAVNTPITVLTLIIALHVFMFSQDVGDITRLLLLCVSVLSFATILITLFFLGRSFSNFFKSHNYKHVNGADKFYAYWKQLSDNNRTKEFEIHFEKELADCAGENFQINKRRREDLAHAKKALFVLILLSILLSLIFIISLMINKMADKEKTNGGKPDVVITPPQSVTIQSDTGDRLNPTAIPDKQQKLK